MAYRTKAAPIWHTDLFLVFSILASADGSGMSEERTREESITANVTSIATYSRTRQLLNEKKDMGVKKRLGRSSSGDDQR